MQCPMKTHECDGSPSPEMKCILKELFRNGKTVYHDNVDISRDADSLNDICYNMYKYLTSIKNILKDCEYVVIEQQLSRNVKAFKLAQTCASFFIFEFENKMNVVDFPAFHKTCVLGAPRTLKVAKNGKRKWKTLSKSERKKWSVKKALEILQCRDEKDTLDNIKTKRKKDDLADTITMCQAFKFIFFVKNKQ